MKKSSLIYSLIGGTTVLTGAGVGVIVAANALKKDEDNISKNQYLQVANKFASDLAHQSRTTIDKFIHTNDLALGKNVVLPVKNESYYPVAELNPDKGVHVTEEAKYENLLKVAYTLKYNNYKVITSKDKVLIALTGTVNSMKELNKKRKLIQHGNHFHEVPDGYETGSTSNNEAINYLDFDNLSKRFTQAEVIDIQYSFFNNGVYEISLDKNGKMNSIELKATKSKYGKIKVDFKNETVVGKDSWADFQSNVTTKHMTLDQSYIKLFNVSNLDEDKLGEFLLDKSYKTKRIRTDKLQFDLTKDSPIGLPDLVPTSGSIDEWKAEYTKAKSWKQKEEIDISFAIAELYLKMHSLDTNNMSKTKTYSTTEISKNLKNVFTLIEKAPDSIKSGFKIDSQASLNPLASNEYLNSQDEIDKWILKKYNAFKNDTTDESFMRKHSDEIGVKIKSITFGGKPLSDEITSLLNKNVFYELNISGGLMNFISSLSMLLGSNKEIYNKFIETKRVVDNGKIAFVAGHMHPGDRFYGFTSQNINEVLTNKHTKDTKEIYVVKNTPVYFTNMNNLQTGIASILRSQEDYNTGVPPVVNTHLTHNVNNFMASGRDLQIDYTVVSNGSDTFSLSEQGFPIKSHEGTGDVYETNFTNEMFRSQFQLREYIETFMEEYN